MRRSMKASISPAILRSVALQAVLKRRVLADRQIKAEPLGRLGGRGADGAFAAACRVRALPRFEGGDLLGRDRRWLRRLL